MRALAIIAAMALSACTTTTDRPGYDLARGFDFSDSAAPSPSRFRAALDAAISGSDSELAFVISQARHTDGEDSMAFGALLVSLRRRVGSDRFDAALRSLPRAYRDAAVGCVDIVLRQRQFLARARETT